MRNASRRPQGRRRVREGRYYFSCFLLLSLWGHCELAGTMKESHSSLSRFLCSPPHPPPALSAWVAEPSFGMPLPIFIFLNKFSSLTQTKCATVFCWGSTWYTQPRHFDWLRILLPGHNLEFQWGHHFFQKVLLKRSHLLWHSTWDGINIRPRLHS